MSAENLSLPFLLDKLVRYDLAKKRMSGCINLEAYQARKRELEQGRRIREGQAMVAIQNTLGFSSKSLLFVQVLLEHSSVNPARGEDFAGPLLGSGVQRGQISRVRKDAIFRLKEQFEGLGIEISHYPSPGILNRGNYKPIYYMGVEEGQRSAIHLFEAMRGSEALPVFSQAKKEVSIQPYFLDHENDDLDTASMGNVEDLVNGIKSAPLRLFLANLIDRDEIFTKGVDEPVSLSQFSEMICKCFGIQYSYRLNGSVNNSCVDQINIGQVWHKNRLKERVYNKADLLAAVIYWGCLWDEKIKDGDSINKKSPRSHHVNARAFARGLVGEKHPFFEIYTKAGDELGFQRLPDFLTEKAQLVSIKAEDLRLMSNGIKSSVGVMEARNMRIGAYDLQWSVVEAIYAIGRKFAALQASRPSAQDRDRAKWRKLGETQDLRFDEFREFLKICLLLFSAKPAIKNLGELHTEFMEYYEKEKVKQNS